MGHQGAGPGQLLGRVLDAYLGAALDPVQDRVLEGRLLELARLREEARRAGKHDGEPLPALFVILDEFSELLSAKPDFIEVFVAIGRLGRSMQIHLLLSSQRLEEGRLHGLESHLSYRIGLRTFSAAESRIVLGVADAYDLPPYPGSGYLKSGTREMTRLWACYVAGQPPERVNAALAPAPTGEPRERVVPPGSFRSRRARSTTGRRRHPSRRTSMSATPATPSMPGWRSRSRARLLRLRTSSTPR